MSTAQQVKTSNEVKTSTALTCEQSQKLVQTMLTMSFGCLSFLRGLFPDDNFIDQRFVPEKVDRNYRKDKSVMNSSSIKIKTLVRGKTTEADLFLDWLEKGVFQSIKLKFLKALSLGIFIDENTPTDLLENYIFGFSYNANGNVSMQVNDENEQISLLDSRKVVQQLMRRFIIITQSLEPLPEKRYLTMRLMFNENAPPDYQPHLFRDASNGTSATVKIPESADLDTYSVGTLDTKYHKVSLKVLSVIDSTKKQVEGSMRKLDPFDLIDNHNYEEASIFSQPNLETPNFASQTTNMLQGYLKSPPIYSTQTQTQIVEACSAFDCECGIPCPMTSSKTLSCSKCRKKVHRLCYGNYRGATISSCISCIGTNSEINSTEFRILMMLRRIYRFMTKKPSFPKSLTALYEALIGKEYDQVTTNLVNISLSILFSDGVFELNDERRKGYNSNNFLKSSNYIDIDHAGIWVNDYGELPCNTRSVWTFIHNSPNLQKCYSSVFIESKSELAAALQSVRESTSKIPDVSNRNRDNSMISSIDLHSLNIADDSQEILIDRKRKHVSLRDFSHNERYAQTKEMQDASPKNSEKLVFQRRPLEAFGR